MTICFEPSMLAMSSSSDLGASVYNMLCNERDGAIWAIDSVSSALIEVAAAVVVSYIVFKAARFVSGALKKG